MTANILLIRLFGILACFTMSSVAREAIIGGNKNEHDQFPYQVTLIAPGYGDVCGGGIIADNLIITAAHCVIKDDGHFRGMAMSVLAGTNDLRKIDKSLGFLAVKKIYVPTEYNPREGSFVGDLAVLKLNGSFAHKPLKHLKLPKNKADTYAGRTAKIAGFGWQWIEIENGRESGGKFDTHIRSVDVEIWSIKSHCQKSSSKPTIGDKQICARIIDHNHPKPRGVCTGDSGGPLVLDGNSVIGVLSISPWGCIESDVETAIYTRVSNYLTFIHNAMKDNVTKYIRTFNLIP